MVRLGQGVDAHRSARREALARAFAAIDEYAVLIARARRRRGSGSAPPRRPATPRNADGFTDGVRARLGVEPEVLTGDEEAALSLSTARCDLRRRPAPPGAGRRHRRRLDRAGPRRRAGRSARRTRWTSARCGCTSATCAATRRPPRRWPPASRDIDAALDACPASTPRRLHGHRRRRHGDDGGRRACSACRRTTADAIDGRVPSTTCTRYVDRLVAMTVAERRALPLACTPVAPT